MSWPSRSPCDSGGNQIKQEEKEPTVLYWFSTSGPASVFQLLAAQLGNTENGDF